MREVTHSLVKGLASGLALLASLGISALYAQLGSAGWSSPVARQAHNLKVVGSNPTPATSIILKTHYKKASLSPAGPFVVCAVDRQFRLRTGQLDRSAEAALCGCSVRVENGSDHACIGKASGQDAKTQAINRGKTPLDKRLQLIGVEAQ